MIDYAADIPLSIAVAAHNGTSHVPDDRGRQEIEDYARILRGDFDSFARHADTDEKRALLDAEFARYRTGYRRRFLVYLAARSRCMSAMITGPARFPTERNRKRNDAADKRVDDLIEFRKRALKAIYRVLRPELAPIMAGDDDAVERLKAEIASAEQAHERMKAANAAIRKHAGAGVEAQIAALAALGFTEEQARKVLVPDFVGRIGFPGFALTNSSANIRRLKERLERVAKAKATPATSTDGANGIRMEDAPPDNRVRLYFPGKPDESTRAALKRNGFRWTPSLGCWQAYRNYHSLQHARAVAGVPAAASPPPPEFAGGQAVRFNLRPYVGRDEFEVGTIISTANNGDVHIDTARGVMTFPAEHRHCIAAL